MVDEDRLLFEQAVEELDEASRSKLGRLKAQGRVAQERRRPSRPSVRLDRSKASPQASIDLHGLRRLDAERALQRFLSDSSRGEILLIVHGKGSGTLRDHVRRVVDGHPRVAEFRRAPRRLGGEGALLVRLRH